MGRASGDPTVASQVRQTLVGTQAHTGRNSKALINVYLDSQGSFPWSQRKTASLLSHSEVEP